MQGIWLISSVNRNHGELLAQDLASDAAWEADRHHGRKALVEGRLGTCQCLCMTSSVILAV
jgi:hypothetical protein